MDDSACQEELEIATNCTRVTGNGNDMTASSDKAGWEALCTMNGSIKDLKVTRLYSLGNF